MSTRGRPTKVESRMHQQEEDYRLIFKTAGVGAAQIDPATGRFLHVNPKLCEITGYSEKEMLDTTFSAITYPEDRQENFDGFQQAVQSERFEYEVEKRYVRKDGQVVWLSVNVTLVRDEAGRPLRSVAMVQDVTERKWAEEELRESHTLLRSVTEETTDAIFVKDAQGHYLMVNSSTARIMGRPAEEILGKDDTKFFPPQVARSLMDVDRRVMSTEETQVYEERVPVAGTSRTYLSSKAPYRNSQGDVAGVIGVAHDITERKLAEVEIEARSRQQAVVAEAGMKALADANLTILMKETVSIIARTLDVEYCKILELLPSGEDLLLRVGVGWKEGLVGSAMVGAGLDSQAGYTLISSEPVVVEYLHTEGRFNGPPLLHEHGVVSGVSIVIHGKDEPFGVLGVHTTTHRIFSRDDVNFLQAVANVLAAAVGRRSAEEALIEIREAERSRIARDMHDEALQDIVYALREIDTRLQLADDGERGKGLEEAANALRRSVAGLRAAIFDLSLAGGYGEGDFVEQLESLVRLHRESSPERKIELSVEGNLARSLGTKTEVELRRIVQEALANVRRHSRASRVSVTVGASGGKLWAEVEDDGRGFGSEMPAGLGTRGMRERAYALGGTLEIESEPGRGTKVRFEMALDTDDEETDSEEGIRILLVEDHDSFREATASVFEWEPGFEVVGQAGSVAEARKMLEDGASEADVAIVDLGLPDGYGGDLIKELRAINPRTQALVLSATLDRADVARAVEAGAAGVLHKSASMDEVVESARRLRAGEALLPLEEVVDLVRFASARKEQEYEAHRVIAQLTPREKEVLQAMAEGLDGQQIAARLAISPVTERNHVSNILTKLGVHSRLQALVFAARHGVVEIR